MVVRLMVQFFGVRSGILITGHLRILVVLMDCIVKNACCIKRNFYLIENVDSVTPACVMS